MGIQNQNHNLLKTTSQAFATLDSSSASGGTFGRVIDASHFSQFNLYVTSDTTVNEVAHSANSYFRPEIWHTYAPDQWYLFSSAMTAQQDEHKSYIFTNFGPYVRLRYFVVDSADATRAEDVNSARAIVRVYLSAKYDF